MLKIIFLFIKKFSKNNSKYTKIPLNTHILKSKVHSYTKMFKSQTLLHMYLFLRCSGKFFCLVKRKNKIVMSREKKNKKGRGADWDFSFQMDPRDTVTYADHLLRQASYLVLSAILFFLL